jgi:hypothetical protein
MTEQEREAAIALYHRLMEVQSNQFVTDMLLAMALFAAICLYVSYEATGIKNRVYEVKKLVETLLNRK